VEQPNAQLFLCDHSELFRHMIRFAREQFNRIKHDEEQVSQHELLFCDTLKLVYNLSLHHEGMTKEASQFCTKEYIN
jgi:hypothetical protein